MFNFMFIVVQNNWQVVLVASLWVDFTSLYSNVNKQGQWNKAYFPNKNCGSANWWIVQRIPMLVLSKHVIKGAISDSEDPQLQFCDDVIPVRYILSRSLDCRHSCDVSAFQCSSEPAEECEAVFMRLNTVYWQKRFEFWPEQTGFLRAVPVLRCQFWKYYLKYATIIYCNIGYHS